MKKVSFELLVIVVLFLCGCGNSGSKFVGEWTEEGYGATRGFNGQMGCNIRIEKNGENYILTSLSSTCRDWKGVFILTKEGNLKTIDGFGIVLAYDENQNKLMLTGHGYGEGATIYFSKASKEKTESKTSSEKSSSQSNGNNSSNNNYSGIVIGSWTGTMGNDKVKFIIETSDGNNLKGHDEINGKRRPLTGNVKNIGYAGKDAMIHVYLKEPGNEELDGEYNLDYTGGMGPEFLNGEGVSFNKKYKAKINMQKEGFVD